MSYLNNLTHCSIKLIYTLKYKYRVPNSDAVMIRPYIKTLLSYLRRGIAIVNAASYCMGMGHTLIIVIDFSYPSAVFQKVQLMVSLNSVFHDTLRDR